ncbi:hypothetical protein N7468_006493 [Penicillium chermesinum]|uniref:Mid2 domain-containing protein n=1 Tax=Penicillium chermesinum TaxID=63820 RepID=A0A9W9NSS2_9EURO|nr:uncharacterized protein N7468_006493 [Penicillium chermesinum]KAJ5225268.1 hypothetical protein N7468_006493 [Penicillium chermesinum]KAJ6140577.1 hypothetical protein N7470_010373 [Penicillium chermesinum]
MRWVGALVMLCGIVLVAADTKNYFTSPASNNGINPVYAIGDDLLVSWVTELGVFNITIWQESLVQQSAASQGNIYSKIHASDDVSNFTWNVQLYGFDLSYSNVFFIWLNPDGPDGFVSTYFNITKPTKSATTTVVPTPTSPHGLNLASPPPSSLTPSPSSSPSSSLSSSTSSSPEMTTTSKIALGVGLGLGLPILCAVSVLVWLKHRQSNDYSNKAIAQMAAPPWPTQPAFPIMRQRHFASSDSQPVELRDWRKSNAHYELPNSPYK